MKKVLVYTIVILLAAIFIYKMWNKKNGEMQAAQKKIFSFSEDSAVAWQSKFDGKFIRCEKKTNGKWECTQPELFPADDNEAVANVKNFNTAEYVSKVDATNDLKKWGLLNPAGEYRIELQGNRQFIIYQGRDTGFKPEGCYVRVEGIDAVWHVEKWFIRALQKQPEELRSKMLVGADPADIKIIEWGNVRINKHDKGWSVNARPWEEVDTRAVDSAVIRSFPVIAEKVWLRRKDIPKAESKVVSVRVVWENNGKENQSIFRIFLSGGVSYAVFPDASLAELRSGYFTNISSADAFFKKRRL